VSSFAHQLTGHFGDIRSTDRVRLGAALLDLISMALADRLDRPDEVPPASQRRALLLRV
jgi:hypothetical protein